MSKFLADFEVEFHIRLQLLKASDSVFQAGDSETGQGLTSEESVDRFSFFFRKHVGSHIESFILWTGKVLISLYPYSRDCRVLRSSKQERKTRLKQRKQNQ